MNVSEYLLAGRKAEDPALIPLGSVFTYGELRNSVESTAAQLLSAGLVKGDRVLLVAENSPFWVASYLGMLHAGMVAVPLPARKTEDEFRYILNQTAPRHAFVDPRVLAAHRPVFESLPVTTQIPQGNAAQVEPVAVNDNDLAALMFTSGSTGTPRGVMVSHRNIIANTDSILAALQLTSSDRMMTVLPFHYCFGTSLLHTHLRIGASLALDSRFLFPESVLQRMRDTECTGFAGVPSHYQILLRKSSLARSTFPKLRYVQQAGGHLAPTFVRQLRQALPSVDIFIMYGQTEATARLTYLPPHLLDHKPGSIGIAISGVTLRVLDEAGNPLGVGEVGEIVAEGDNITRGYWHDEEETAKSFRNGRLYTGDLARVDEDGFLYVMDRARDLIKCGGTRVSCRALEETMLEFDELLEVAVIAVPDEVLGEAVKAFVVPRFSANHDLEGRLRAFCRQRLPLPQNPKEIVILDALPKNSASKVSKAALRNV